MKKRVLIPDVLFFQEGPGVRKNQYTDYGVKLLNVSNLVNGHVDLSTSDRYISEEEAYGKYKHFLVDEGDFIIASSGIKVEYFDKKMGFINKSHLPLCMNTSTIRFKSLDNSILNIRYFMYFLKSNDFKYQLFRNITGSAQLNFGPSHLKKMKLPIIDIHKQKQIVSILDTVSGIIEKRKKQLGNLDELVKARFVEMFGDPVENEKRWNKIKLGELFFISSSKRIYQKDLTPIGIPFLRVNDLKRKIKGEKEEIHSFISNETYEKLIKDNMVPINGDILITSRGSIGDCYEIKKNDKFYFQDGMISWLSNKKECITTTYLIYLFNNFNLFDKKLH
ncbi:restriction endonuclease subunit S [uncultured Anaerofustis sp.]|uniref:restriction endonuclease subunit S n=1 Tax=uncultured Anaerofustis sp. TaxID=904996 RepID=UPI0026007F06|nr:restriction endonuclease subunit S [uncultured Anaerofustis sp.]